MTKRNVVFVVLALVAIAAFTIGSHAYRTQAAAGGAHCGHGIKACDAGHVGQPCDPKQPNLICSAQANGAYCCLAVAP